MLMWAREEASGPGGRCLLERLQRVMRFSKLGGGEQGNLGKLSQRNQEDI